MFNFDFKVNTLTKKYNILKNLSNVSQKTKMFETFILFFN